MGKTKQFLMGKIDNDELVFNNMTGVFEPNMDNPKVRLAFAEAEFESSLAALRNALDKLDKTMPERIDASEKIRGAIELVGSWIA